MFSLRLPNPVVIFELLQKAGASALVCEPSFGVELSGCPVPTYSAIQVREQDAADVPLPPLRTDYSASDIIFIFHTSGSTSGSPKLVRCSLRWLDNLVTKSRQLGQVRSTHGQDVSVAMYGSSFNSRVDPLSDVGSTEEACATLDRQTVSSPRWLFFPFVLYTNQFSLNQC